MLYKLVCVCLVATCVRAAPAPDSAPEKQQPTVIPIVSQSEELEPNGTYKYSYETGNGIKREETSYDKIVPKARSAASSDEGGEDDSDEIHVQQGSYSYTAPDGTLISVRYIADENGFQPIGDHIPRIAPPSSDSSSEKSGRALKSADSASAGSAPAIVGRSAAPESAGKPAKSSAPEAKPEASAAPSPAESQTEAASTPSESSTSSESSTPLEQASTAASNASEAPEASSTTAPEATSTTVAAEASTSAEAASSDAPEASSTSSPDASSTTAAEESSSEASSTAAPTSTQSSEESSSPASTPADASTTAAPAV